MQPFDKRIRETVGLFSYPVWFAIRDEKINCPCVNFTTGQADAACGICFGTGKKTMLRKVMAAHQSSSIRIGGELMGTGETVAVNVYYTLTDVKAKEGDFILDGDELDVIQQRFSYRSDSSSPVYYRYDTAPKKTDNQSTAEVIRKTLKEAGYA